MGEKWALPPDLSAWCLISQHPKWVLLPRPWDVHVPAWPMSFTLLLCYCLSFLWERMFDIQAIPSSILDVSFHGSISHHNDCLLLTFIPQLFVLATPRVLLTGQNQAKAISPAHIGRGDIYHPSASQQDASLRIPGRTRGQCPPSISFWAVKKMFKQRFNTTLKTSSEVKYMKRVDMIESAVSNEVSGGGEPGW